MLGMQNGGFGQSAMGRATSVTRHPLDLFRIPESAAISTH
jgi:hypothetical protein